jgi:hypothetical protein
VMVEVGDMFLNERHCKRDLLTIVVEFHVVKLKVKDIPLSAVDRFIANSIFGFAVRDPRRTTVGLKSFLIS